MLKPLSDRIIVEIIDAKEVLGGIWLPDRAKETLAYGKVLAVGPGRVNTDGNRHPMVLKKGDTVVFRPNAGDWAIMDGEEILTMYEGDVIGTI